MSTTKKKRAFIGAGLDALIGSKPSKAKTVVKAKTYAIKTDKPSAERGCKEGETRVTVIANKETLEKLYAIAYWERQTLKEVIYPALEDAVAKYERKSGPVKPIPKKK